jgi:hypothetical protein
MGQQRSVMVFRLVARATVEERMLQVCARDSCSWVALTTCLARCACYFVGLAVKAAAKGCGLVLLPSSV